MRRREAERVLEETRDTYDAIAHHFSKTRYAAGAWLHELAASVPKDAVVLDVGCGNGRLIEVLPESVMYTGVDVSEKLLMHARKKYPTRAFHAFDGLHLPLPDNSFSHIFMLAAFHHIPKPFQLQLLSECNRVLMPSGKLTLTAWHLWRKPFLGYLIRSIPEKFREGNLDVFDIYVPWKDQQQQLGARYFHMLTKRELIRLLIKAQFKNVRCSVRALAKQKNYIATGEKDED